MGACANNSSSNTFSPARDAEAISCCLEEAELLANAVSAGLESEDYACMNSQLASLAQRKDDGKACVFAPSAATEQVAVVIACAILSAVLAYCLFIGTSTLALSKEHLLVGASLSILSCIGLIVDAALVIASVRAALYKMRFARYSEHLGYKELEFTEDIAAAAHQREPVVVKDLQAAVKQKLIPQGHFSREGNVFMISDEAYGRYMEKPAVYDRYFLKTLEERRRIESRTEQVSQIIEKGERYLDKLSGYEAIIKDKPLSRKVGEIERVTAMILREIDTTPNSAQSLGMFLNYYLPTTEKLLDAYATSAERPDLGRSAVQTRQEVEKALDTIEIAFRGILEKLYRNREMDVASDIAAMELSMRQEGLPTSPQAGGYGE